MRQKEPSNLERIGVAIDGPLLEKFDELIASRGYTNRSEAFRIRIRRGFRPRGGGSAGR